MSNSIEYYLSRGFEQKAAEYFASGRRKITAVSPNDDFSLTIRFDNGELRKLDMTSILQKGTVFEPFAKLEEFKRVYLDRDSCISWDIDPAVDSEKVWSNKVDLCPDSCYIDSVPIA